MGVGGGGWGRRGRRCGGSQSSVGRRVTVDGAAGRFSFTLAETVLSQQNLAMLPKNVNPGGCRKAPPLIN